MKPRFLTAIAMVALSMTGAASAAPMTQLEASVARELKRVNLEADVQTLSSGQLSALHMILTGQRSQDEKRGLAKSVLGGRNSLRGLLVGGK